MLSIISMKRSRCSSAFTLVELLVVISIISLLSSVVLASIDTAKAKGRDGKRTVDLVQFRNALELYGSNHNGQYPPVSISTSGVNTAFTSKGLITFPVGQMPACPSTGTNWTSSDNGNQDAKKFVDSLNPYLSSLPIDPINDSTHCFIYSSSLPADTGVIYSSKLETSNLLTGVVTGSNITTYPYTANVPLLANVIGVTGSTGTPGGGSNPAVTAFVISANQTIYMLYGSAIVSYTDANGIPRSISVAAGQSLQPFNGLGGAADSGALAVIPASTLTQLQNNFNTGGGWQTATTYTYGGTSVLITPN